MTKVNSSDITTTLVVDDHAVVRQSLAAFIDSQYSYRVVGEASSGKEAVIQAHSLMPDIIVMDLAMNNGNGLSAIKQIKQSNLDCKILILSSYLSDALLFEVLDYGVNGYLPKEASIEELLIALNDVSRVGKYFHSSIVQLVKQYGNGTIEVNRLTQREKDVISLISKGCNNQQISEQLCIGIKTVKTHIGNILSKLQLRDRTQIAIHAIHHLID